MSSQIDSQNIDKTFPIAGQDNNSQGFRDNFDAIQRNFQFTKSEIESLQAKAVLKSPLASTGTVSNNLGGSSVTNGSHNNFHGTAYNQPGVSGTANVDITNGSLQLFSLNSDSVFTFTNWPTSGNYAKVRVHLSNNSSVVTVGNDVVVGRRYTTETVGTTNFVTMGADPSARIRGTITGNILTVTVISAGSLAAGTVISGPSVIAGTQIIEQQAGGTVGGTGTYVINQPQTVGLTIDMTGMVPGIVFVATAKGSGNGTVKQWVLATLATEGTGLVVPSADLNLPLEINPSGSEQVIEAWTATGNTSRKVFIDYVGNLGTEQSNFFTLNVGSLVVGDPTDSTDPDSGSVVLAGGMGVTKNLNVGGNVSIDGNLVVIGNTTLTTSSITIQDIGTITNVEIVDPVRGDVLKYNPTGAKWSNNVDLETFVVQVADNGANNQDVFFLNSVPLSTNTGVQNTFLKFEIGKKYRFDLSHQSNDQAKLRFSITPDIVVPTTVTPYTDNVTIGSNFVEITITPETPSPLYLYADEVGLDTSLIGAAFPIQVGDGPVLVVKDYSPYTSQNILVNTADNTVTIRLPVNTTQRPLTPGTFYTVTDSGNAGTNNIIIDPINNVATINGVTGQRRIVGNYSAVTLVTDGVNWTMINSAYNGSEDVAANATISNSTSVSYFSTGPSAETAVLPNGVEGQIKTLIMRSFENTMTVTVASAGWRTDGSQGSILFDKTGDCCILQYIDTKWYVISNNDCRINGSGPAEMTPAPAAASSTGRPGQLAFDSEYLYVCVANNTWKTVPFNSTFRGGYNEGTTNLNSLTDVTINGAIVGQVLKWNGVLWTNSADNT